MLTVDFERFPVEPGHRVLDMGCGGGRHAFALYRRGAHVVALDMDAAELKDVAGMFAAMAAEDEVPEGATASALRGTAYASRRSTPTRTPRSPATPRSCWPAPTPLSTSGSGWSRTDAGRPCGCQGRCRRLPNTSASVPWTYAVRSTTIPSLRATPCDGVFSGRMIATRCSMPAAAAQSRTAVAASVA